MTQKTLFDEEEVEEEKEEQEEDIKIGMKVVVRDIRPTFGFMVVYKHLHARRIGGKGVVTELIPGHGGEVYAVQHEDETIAVYHVKELEREDD